MSPKWFLFFLGVSLHTQNVCGQPLITDLTRAQEFLYQHNEEYAKVYSRNKFAQWNYYSNITDYNEGIMMATELELAAFKKEAGRNASMFDWKNFSDNLMMRQFSKIADLGYAAMPNKEDLERLNRLRTEMEKIYNENKFCFLDKDCYDINGLSEIMAESRDYARVTKAWLGWRENMGGKMKEKYEEFVYLSNKAIRANGYKDTGDYWRSWYDSDTFVEDVENLMEQLMPLYRELHAYTRRHLINMYGRDKFDEGGHIPAQLLGNMWAQTWKNLYDDLRPYKDKAGIDVTPEMIDQGYTPEKMFRLSDKFFTSLGLEPMPQAFWDHSIIEEPTDGRDLDCFPTEWDFYNQKDFRMLQCTQVTMTDLILTHSQMGYIQYFLQYKDQPAVFREPANPGFHLGDVVTLSVTTPEHLQKVGLLFNAEDDTESDINYMLSVALDKIAFLPFGYLMDQWRWSVFSGETVSDFYNTKWWQLRCKYQGVSPPKYDHRGDQYFDPGAKYHIPGNYPYMRYFVGFVIQFQFHKALCEAAGHTGPLHKCDIYNSKEAGDLLSRVLKLGASRPWPEVMKILTGQDKMDAGPLLEYFQPLYDWLKKKNMGHETGWDQQCPGAGVTDSAQSNRMFDPIILACLLLAYGTTV